MAMRASGTRYVVAFPVFTAALVLAGESAARGDIFHLKNKQVVDGEVVEEGPERLRVRVPVGVIEIGREEVVRREAADPPWVRYETERAKRPDTADGHYALALWCKDNRLHTEAKKELLRAVELDPGFAPAQQLLGRVREGDRWVEPKRPVKPPPPPLEQLLAEHEKAVQQATTKWHVKITAMRSTKLDRGAAGSSVFEAGRRQILAIRDPLALTAMAAVLSSSRSVDTRGVLVEALSQFKEDESTLNLLVLSLFDPSPVIRRAAAKSLSPRKDGRLLDELSEALKSDEDRVIRNAAIVIGIVEAIEIADELIPYLETQTLALVSVPRDVYFLGLVAAYGHPTCGHVSGFPVRRYCDCVPVLVPGSVIGTYWVDELQYVSVYRTEVQEALIRLTGVNLGFDAEAWRDHLRKRG